MGRIVCTKAIDVRMEEDESFRNFVLSSLNDFFNGDFGELSEEDEAANIEDPFFQLGAYRHDEGERRKIWIMKEDNIVTVLYPEEY